MWLSLEFHYVSKDTLNDMASQVRVNGSMTESFPSTQEGNRAKGMQKKPQSQCCNILPSVQEFLSLKTCLLTYFTRKLFTDNEPGIIHNIGDIF